MTEHMTDYLRAAQVELDRIDGTLRPEFVKVQDGFYTQRIVLDEQVKARWITDADASPDPCPAFHYEPCRIPRYRTELRWKPTQNDGGDPS